LADFGGSRLDYTPEWTGNGNVQYQWRSGSGLKRFVGASLSYNSSANATFATAAVREDGFRLKSFALLDLRAGIGAEDDSWKLSIFGRNVTNTYYWNTVFQSPDTRLRFVGRPATFGVSFSARTK